VKRGFLYHGINNYCEGFRELVSHKASSPRTRSPRTHRGPHECPRPRPDLHNMDINLKSPGRIIVEEQQFSPVVMKGEHGAGPKTMILHSKKGIPSPVVVEVKGIVTLSEAVQVPAVPKIEILQLKKCKLLVTAW
jgi:hypothetical protein